MKHLARLVSRAGRVGCRTGMDGAQAVNGAGGTHGSRTAKENKPRAVLHPLGPCLRGTRELAGLARGRHWARGGMFVPVLTPPPRAQGVPGPPQARALLRFTPRGSTPMHLQTRGGLGNAGNYSGAGEKAPLGHPSDTPRVSPGFTW